VDADVQCGGESMDRRRVLPWLAGTAIGAASLQGAPQTRGPEASRDHTAWVAEVLKRMQGIQPGMTREALLKVFTTEGGLSTGLERTFVSRDCPLFKVHVEFQAVGRPNRDKDGRETLVEGSQDIILKISTPYLQFTILE
jgi:hypothetical protein